MTFRFSLTTEDLTKLHVYNAWSAPWRQSYRKKLGMILPLGIAFYGAIFLLEDTSWLGIGVLVMAVLLFVYYKFMHEDRIRVAAQGFYNHSINERFWIERTYTFSATQIRIKDEYADTKLEWKSIKNVIERQDAFWLFETLSDAYIIPKRVLKAGEAEQFKQLLSEKLLA